MARKKNKPRGSSKAGRPRKTGDRFPCGKLRAPEPNARVLEQRKAGDSEAGEYPLDFALSNRWITPEMHLTAKNYASAYSRAHIGGPRLALGGLCEVVPTEDLRLNWSEMSDVEIASIFDDVFNAEPQALNPEQQEAASLADWKRLNLALTSEERQELFMVCVVGSWPLWMPKQASNHALGATDTRKRASLFTALEAVSRALRPKKPKETITSLPAQRKIVAKSEVPVRYQTEDGIEVEPRSRHGKPFEVTVRRRRREGVG